MVLHPWSRNAIRVNQWSLFARDVGRKLRVLAIGDLEKTASPGSGVLARQSQDRVRKISRRSQIVRPSAQYETRRESENAAHERRSQSRGNYGAKQLPVNQDELWRCRRPTRSAALDPADCP